MTPQQLIATSKEAINLMNGRDFRKAARCWEGILEVQPDWEHGSAAYNVAFCYEENKQVEDARRMYCKALQYEPGNPIYLGGYGSFLYLQGWNKDAYDIYKKLFSQGARQ